MSQTVVSTQVSADGLTQTVVYSDGSTTVGPAPGSVAATAQANQASLYAKAQTALTNNQAFLAATKPSTAAAQASAAYDQATKLTRQVDALIRLQLAAFDTISDT